MKTLSGGSFDVIGICVNGVAGCRSAIYMRHRSSQRRVIKPCQVISC